MASIDTAIKWFSDRAGKVSYSMADRLGPNSYDCSSAVYNALIAGGLLPSMRIGNTDTLFGDLERNGWTKIQPNSQGNFDTRRGDVFIWGVRGASGGAAGHTGIFDDADYIWNCIYYYNTIHRDPYDNLQRANGWPTATYYRYTGSSYVPPTNAVDQVLEVGSVVKFDRIYRADEVQFINGTWQVRTQELCKEGFTWDDNGIPAGPLVEVDSEGYATADQDLTTGDKLYKIPGKYAVLDVGQSGNIWLALVDMGGYKVWLDVETATEIASGDPGTPTPGQRPVSTPTTPEAPAETPNEPETPTTPSEPEAPTEPATPEEPTTKPEEEPEMAFSQEQQKELQAATQQVLDTGDFQPVISDRVKTAAYFVTDIVAVVSGLIFTVLAIFQVLDAVVAITVNAAITTALLGLKQTFRLSNKKQ